MCRWQCQSPRRRNLVQKYRFGKLLWWKNRVDHFWSLSREDACCKRWRPEGHRVPSSAANTRFDSLDLDFSFFFRTTSPRLIPKGGFSPFFCPEIRFPRSHDQEEGCVTAYLDSLLNAGLQDSESDTEPWHKKMAPPQKRGDETWGTKRLEVSDLIDNWWWQKILEVLKESWPFHSHLIDVTMLVGSSAPRTVTPQKSHRRWGVENCDTLPVIDSHGTMIHGAPWCVFAARSHSQHWNWSPNLQPWSWKLTPYWVAWCQGGFCHYVSALEIYHISMIHIIAPGNKPWNCQSANCRWAHANFWKS